MNYTEYQKNVAKAGSGKVAKIFGWFFLIAGIMVFLVNGISAISWNMNKGNYEKQYVTSSVGDLNYELKGETIYIEKLFNTDNEEITLKLPDKQTAIVYCEKSNPSNCIYFNMDNTIDQSTLNPIISLFISLFLIAMGLYFVLTKKYADQKKVSTNPLFTFFLFLFLMGTGCIIYQIYSTINYLSLKSQNNVTTATIYSEIYNKGADNDVYKPVASYYVNGEKYIYVKDLYIKGSLQENENKTFELYYDKSNPNKVSEKKTPIDIKILLIGVGFTIFGSIGLFRKKKMEENIAKSNEKLTNSEWKV